jgi:hypothetical protein
MIRYACLWAVLTATITFAQTAGASRCESDPKPDRPAGAANAVVFWNAVADNSIAVVGGKPPQLGSVEAAMVQTAIYDAVDAICGYPFAPYAVRPDVRNPAMPEAAVAAAAHDVLIALYPTQAAALDQQYAAYLITFPGREAAKRGGISVGQQAAAGILALRANDGRNAGTVWDPPPPGPGVWQPTPPGFLPPATPWVGSVTPWTMTGPSQFRVRPPPALDTDMWVRDYDETKAYGGAVSSVRTPEQADLAAFVGGVGVHPMLQWHWTWRVIAAGQGLSLLDTARLFAMLATAASDALIGCWDSKFTYAFWRPVTAIGVGGGNLNLVADPTWIGFVVTPNHPEYPAAHGCLSGSVVEVLKEYFGTDRVHFTMSSPALGLLHPVRAYDRFSQALEDILNARIYGGMHYRNSTRSGTELGRQVARQVIEHFFLPRRGD